MAFDGFTKEQFAIFGLKRFEDRMPALRANITPALKELGALLTPELSALCRQNLYPHTALHMRRTVNPPVETWVAFGRSPRSYKPFIHLRVAVNRRGVRVVCFVEDDSGDKADFARALAANSRQIAGLLSTNPHIYSIDLADSAGLPLYGPALTEGTLAAFAARLGTVKGQHAGFAINLGRGAAATGSYPGLRRRVIKAAKALRPLFDLVSSDRAD